MSEPRIGTVERDRRGEWIIVGTERVMGDVKTSRVRRGSLAHQVLSQSDARLREALLAPESRLPLA